MYNDCLYSLKLDYKTSDNGESERKETLIGKVQKNNFPPMPTGFSINIGIKEPPSEERKRYCRNSSSVSQVSAVQAQTSASCCRTPSDCSDRIQRHCGRFKNSSNRVPVHKTVMGKKKTLTPSALWHKGFYIMFGLRPHNISKTSHLCRLVMVQKYNEFLNLARNVNFELTFGRACSELRCRKIAAIYKLLCHNALCASGLHARGCEIVVLNVVGSSPTGHPTNKPSDYQVIRGYFCTQNRPNPP